jgi:hypothetical protein
MQLPSVHGMLRSGRPPPPPGGPHPSASASAMARSATTRRARAGDGKDPRRADRIIDISFVLLSRITRYITAMTPHTTRVIVGGPAADHGCAVGFSSS